MKAIFLVDNIPAMAMFAPVMVKLSSCGWDVAFINYDGFTAQTRNLINDYAKGLPMRCITLSKHNKKCVETVLKYEYPNIIVLAREETTPVEPLFAKLGRGKGIPTLLIPHGVIMRDERSIWGTDGRFFKIKSLRRLAHQGFNRWSSGNVSLWRLLLTGIFRARNDFKDGHALSRYDNYSRIVAYGSAMRDILVARDVKPESIVLTGNPKFDVYCDIDKNNYSFGGNRILLITNYFVEFGLWNAKQRETFVMDVYSVAKFTSSNRLKIKIHPVRENIKDYEKIKQKYELPIDIYQHEPTKELIGDCDIAITTTSSVGLEAMVAGKPLIIYNPYNDATVYEYGSGVYTARSATELLKAILDIQKHGMGDEREKLVNQFVYEQAYIQDGKATDRIVDLICNMTGVGKNE